MDDGSYQLIEVKGDNMIDNAVVLAKKDAAEEMSIASGMRYLMYAGSLLMNRNVLEDPNFCQTDYEVTQNGLKLEIEPLKNYSNS